MIRSFRYSGPPTSATLRQEDGSDLEVILAPGKTLELPEESPYVQSLVALRRLQPLPPGTRTRRGASDPAPSSDPATI